MPGATYSIKKNRIQRGYYPGFELTEKGVLKSVDTEVTHRLYLRAIDTAKLDSEWGRLTIRGTFSEGTVCYVHVIALNEDSFYRQGVETRIEDFLCNPQESHRIKKEFFSRVGGLRFVNAKDMLLYELKGRYLYLMLEVMGEGACEITGMRVDALGDNFMNTFPEVYQERNSFFHRYLSVFSTIYQDFDDDIEKLPELLDVDTCPVELLPLYAKWMGVNVGKDFLEERILRPLVKEAYELNRMKGTKAVLERIAKIVLEEDVLVLERNMMQEYISRDQMQEFERLYGNSIYDVTILVSQYISEVKKSQLLFLLNQFKPIRTRLHIILLKQEGTLDDYSYLDMNAKISTQREGCLDESHEIDGVIRLQ